MKIITTIEATTDAEQAEVAKLVALLTGVIPANSVSTDPDSTPADAPAPKKARKPRKPKAAKVVEPEPVVADPPKEADDEANRHELRMVIREATQQGLHGVIRSVLSDYGAARIPDVKAKDVAECTMRLQAQLDEAHTGGAGDGSAR